MVAMDARYHVRGQGGDPMTNTKRPSIRDEWIAKLETLGTRLLDHASKTTGESLPPDLPPDNDIDAFANDIDAFAKVLRLIDRLRGRNEAPPDDTKRNG
jgi:hypothetical protein